MDFGLSSKINILENSQLHYHMHFFKNGTTEPTKAPLALTLSLPSKPLSEVMPSPSIQAANKLKEVKSIILESSKNDAASTTASTVPMKRGQCVKLSQQADYIRCLWQHMHRNVMWQQLYITMLTIAICTTIIM